MARKGFVDRPVALAVITLTLGAGLFAQGTKQESTARRAVLVELFTSQGCSSCPAADRLLSRITKETVGAGVVTVAYHVDYWNRLGWKDPFSSSAWSARQSAYAQVRGSSQVYTPQAVVDGRVQLVGSNEALLRRSIAEAMRRPVSGTVALKMLEGEGIRVNVQVRMVEKTINDVRVIVLLVEDDVLTDVTRGENGGRKLVNDSIVRSSTVIATLTPTSDRAFAGVVNLPVEREWKRNRLRVVAFLQDARTLSVHAVNSVRWQP